jgi:hypothetical protein
MTSEPYWYRNSDSGIYWLRASENSIAEGLLERRRDSWYVATWNPNEKAIARLPGDMPEDEAKAAAKLLILLSLKEADHGT